MVSSKKVSVEMEYLEGNPIPNTIDTADTNARGRLPPPRRKPSFATTTGTLSDVIHRGTRRRKECVSNEASFPLVLVFC